MKKTIILLPAIFLLFSNIYSVERSILHTYKADYSLFPDTKLKNNYVQKISSKYKINYCVQSNIIIPKNEARGYTCSEILKKLDQMGGLDKECYGVSYIDGNTGERKPIFKKAKYDAEKNELYVKDKAAGGLHFDVLIDRYEAESNIYAVNAVINKKPDNFFVRGIKKNEAEIFVFMQENKNSISVYALIQCSYSPVEHKFLNPYVEKSVSSRVIEIQNWFYRMICGV